MGDMVASFIRAKHIDSFQKLCFLLFLHQHPDLIGTSQEFAERLYLGDVQLLEEIITDLQMVGLVDCVENRYKLRNEPNVRSRLQYLARSFEDPLSRQEILDQVRYTAPPWLVLRGGLKSQSPAAFQTPEASIERFRLANRPKNSYFQSEPFSRPQRLAATVFRHAPRHYTSNRDS